MTQSSKLHATRTSGTSATSLTCGRGRKVEPQRKQESGSGPAGGSALLA